MMRIILLANLATRYPLFTKWKCTLTCSKSLSTSGFDPRAFMWFSSALSET